MIAATVAEYNPFHLGHEYMLKQVRDKGFDSIIAIMSGNFVQRGDCAVSDKRSRTKMALACGADLVIELPLPYAMATAQKFAYGAAELIRATGCVDAIAFGSECGDADLISYTANLINGDITEQLRPFLDKGMTFAAAREKAIKEIDPMAAKLLRNPNDTLAVEYLSGLKNSAIKPIAIKRIGAKHDGKAENGYCSASEIRRMIRQGETSAAFEYMPDSAADILRKEIYNGLAPADIGTAEIAMISKFRQMSISDIKELSDISEGLENRIASAIKNNVTLDAIAESVKSKRYTMARIRRILLSAYLDVKSTYTCGQMPYIRVLGANETGRKVLSIMKKTASLPVVSRAKEINALDKRAVDMFSLECRSTDLYWLMTPQKMPCGKEMTDAVIMI